MNSNNIQTPNVLEHQSSIDLPPRLLEDINEYEDESESEDEESVDYIENAKTLKNFKDFDNMFREMDLTNCGPRDIAFKVYIEVSLERDQSRHFDVCSWIEGDEYLKIERNAKFAKFVPNKIRSNGYILAARVVEVNIM